MRNHTFAWRPSTVAVAASLCLMTVAVQAQQTAGSIVGRAAPGATIEIESSSIGIKRSTTADSAGSYQLPQVPAGTYTITVRSAGTQPETREVVVAAGSGSTINFLAAQMITITGSAVRTLDMAAVNPSYTVSRAEIDRIPIASNVTAVTLLAPGTVQGEAGFGVPGARSANLASINGSSVAENAYYINGFNVTNINKGIAFNEVPFGAVGEVQILNGGYGVNYGRSLGGVVSVNTKRGTNEWKGGGSIAWSPRSLRGDSVYADQSSVTGNWNLVPRPSEIERTTASVYAGGPLIKDSLYAFALFEGRKSLDRVFGQDDHIVLKSDSPKYLVKLDWNVNRNNLLEFTHFSDKVTDTEDNYSAIAPYTTQLGADNGQNSYTTGGNNTIVKWTSFLTENLSLSALAGQGKYLRNTNVTSAGCPIVQERRRGLPSASLGCWTVGVIDIPAASDKRDAYRLDLEWNAGKHTVRAGLDHETFTTVDGSSYSGGEFHRVLRITAGAQVGNTGYINTTGAPLDVVRYRVLNNGGTFKTTNSAWFIEDSWQAMPNFVVTGGIRSESFENLNDKGLTFIKVKDTISPRAGFAWDLKGNGSTKLYGNAGRYYIPVYSNTNVRLSGAELFYEDYFLFNGYAADRTEKPILGAQLGTRTTFSDGSPKDPRTVVDPNLKPLFQDEFILGIEQALSNRWSVGVKYTNRKLKSGMDDICESDLAEAWALTAGYTASQAANIGGTVGNCFLYNPGKNLLANVDLDDTGELTPVTIPASALLNPPAIRKYDSLEFIASRQWDGKWSAQASLVVAWSRGNTEGYVKSDNQQDDAGITTDFDHPGLMEGAYGWLPNDRRYTLKAAGAYALTDEWRVSANAVIQSGRPLNCYGYYAGSIPDNSLAYGAASYYCNGVLGPRGSAGRLAWTRDLSVQVQYQPMWAKGLTIKGDIFNVFNNRAVRAVNEEGEAGSSGSPNVDYLRPRLSGVQAARSVRLTATYDF